MLKNTEKIEIAKFQLDFIKEQLNNALSSLNQAQEDWIQLNSCDGNKESVKKHPILSSTDALVSCEMALKLLDDMERMLKHD